MELEPFDPFAVRENPFPAFASFRSVGGFAIGIAPYPEIGEAHYVFSHDLVTRALKHQSLVQSPPGAYELVRQKLTSVASLETLTRSMLLSDPPRHGLLRRPLASSLSVNAVSEFGDTLRQQARDLASKASSNGTFDAVNDLAIPLSFWVLEKLLGIPIDDPWLLKSHATQLANALDMRSGPVDKEADEASNRIASWVADTLERGEILSHGMVARMLAEVDAGRWTREDMHANILFLIFAGQETVVDALGNALSALERSPEQKATLARREVSWEQAADELLRFGPPIHYGGARIALEDIRIGDFSASSGEAVVPVLASANYDERVFLDGEKLDLTRTPSPSLTFGSGLHVCLGKQVARLELAAMLEALFTITPEWQLDLEHASRRQTTVFAGLRTAPIRRTQSNSPAAA